MIRLFSIVFILFTSASQAYDYSFNGGVIDIPEGFEGPVSHNLNGGATSTSFTFTHADNTATFLQITAWAPPKKLPELTKEELIQASGSYLLQFLSGVEGRRANFMKDNLELLYLDNIPAAKADWTGTAQGVEVYGKMYSVINNSIIYSFHAQSYQGVDDQQMNLAVDAILNLKFNKP